MEKVPKKEELARVTIDEKDKVSEHQKGIKEAKFYNMFLDELNKKVQQKMYDLDKGKGLDLSTTDKNLRELLGAGDDGWFKVLGEISQQASKVAGNAGLSTEYHVTVGSELGEMTPTAFVKYINQQKATLIKY